MRKDNVLVLVSAVVLAGCNRYELFRIAGYQQATFTNRADVLFVIDNSDTMYDESEALAVNFDGFIRGLDQFEQELSYEGLPAAVDNFVEYVQNRGAFLDYQFSMTTTDVNVTEGELLGPPVERGEENVASRFIGQLACEGTCYFGAIPTDPQYDCGDPLGEFLVEEFLACECGGANSWQGNCGTAVEEPLEAVLLAMCRSVPNPPKECFEDVVYIDENENEVVIPALITDNDILSNEGMLRENANFIPVIVTDEGDNSRRLREQVRIPDAYERIFSQFNKRMSWVVIGPENEPSGEDARCTGTAQAWGVARFDYLIHTTDGLKVDIFSPNCDDPTDFEGALGQLADLLSNLLTSFPLQSVPVPGSIIVLVDGEEVVEADVTGQDEFGLDVYSDGWSYRISDNSIAFHGTAIPEYNAAVEVYYLPVDGMPRELPF